MRQKFLVFLAIVAVTCWAGVASADTVYYLTAGNSAISGYTGPYAKVDVDLTSSTTATITFTSLTNAGNIYLMGATSAVDVNVNATSWTLGTVTGTNAGTGFTPGSYSNGGSKNADGFGSFNQTIVSFDGFTHSADNITFTLTDTSGTWGSSSNVLTPNADGDYVAAHILVTSYPADASNSNPATGYAAGNTAVPLDCPWLLMGTSFLVLNGLRWRKKHL